MIEVDTIIVCFPKKKEGGRVARGGASKEGIKIKLDDTGEAQIVDPEPEPGVAYNKCMIQGCEYATEDYRCQTQDGVENVWDIYEDPGWCPRHFWYRSSRARQYWKSKGF